MFEALELGQRFARLGESRVDAEDSIVGDGCKPPCPNLEDVELLVLLEVIGKGVAFKINGKQVTGWESLGIRVDVAYVKDLCVASLPQGELMDGKC